MDPQETWRMLLDAWFYRNWDDVLELSEALLNWLEKDGFAPQVESPRELGPELNRLLVRTACEFMRKRATVVLESPNGIPQDVGFSLTCSECNNEGPESYDEAIAEGWAGIEYVPHLSSENFLGSCPTCLAEYQ